MPYPNEHSCRIRDPADFEKDSFRRITQGSRGGKGPRDGKKLDIIIGRPKGKTTTATQAYRYPKDDWTEAQAREHCKEEGGSFEAASGKGSPDPPEVKSLVAVEFSNADQGEVEAVFTRFQVKDLEGDYTLPGAFEDGAPVRISAHEHSSWGSRGGMLPVGRGVIKATPSDARLVGRFFLNTTHGRETFETVRELGELQHWSYGYDVLEKGEVTPGLKAQGVKRVLARLYVHEVSPAFRAVGLGTGTVSLKAYDQEREEEQRKLEELKSREAELAEQREQAEIEYLKFMRTGRRLGL